MVQERRRRFGGGHHFPGPLELLLLGVILRRDGGGGGKSSSSAAIFLAWAKNSFAGRSEMVWIEYWLPVGRIQRVSEFRSEEGMKARDQPRGTMNCPPGAIVKDVR